MVLIPQANIEFHVHPFLNRNSLEDVVKAMNKKKLDVVALEALDYSIYPTVVKQAQKLYPSSFCDNAGIQLSDSRYILNAREYNTKESFHILTVGYSFDEATPQTEIRRIIDTSLNKKAIVILDHSYVDNRKGRTAANISQELELTLEELCKEYSGEITVEWNGYCKPLVRLVLKYGLNLLKRIDIKYHDVNKKVERLSKDLKRKGYNVPVVADTDVHARTKKHLSAMGTARIITDIEGECPADIITSLKQNIFTRRYKNIKKYVSIFHLITAFGIPILLPNHFKKPRA